MDKSNIGFMGGCINNQNGIPRANSYYSVLSKLISDDRNNPDLQISLGRYFSYDQLVCQTGKFIDEKKPNLLFLFIRPFPLMPLHKPLIKYDKANGKTGRALHPGLFTRETKWEDKLTENQHTDPVQLMTRKLFELRDLNLMAGVLLGLHHWALKYLTQQLESVRLLCKEQRTEFIVISPPKNPESIAANIICKWTTGYLNTYCNNHQIGFVNIHLISRDNFEKDNIHFNINGHKKLGQLLYNEIISHKSSAFQFRLPQ